MATNTQTIWSYFEGKGLNPVEIASIMGNLRIESDFDPTSANPNEGAIGIAQWEGGRRTALQNFAASEGKSETDLSAQLDFLWHELNTTFSGALADLRHATDPAQGAAIFDGEYEISAGTSRQARITNANDILAAWQTGGQAGLGSFAGISNTGSSGAASVSAPSGQTAPSASDLENAFPGLSGLFGSVPELKGILDQAVAGGWATTKFQQAVEGTTWWKQHNDAAKSLIALQFNDPAQYKTQVANAQAQVQNLARQLGVGLSAAQVNALTQQFMIQGWDQQTLTTNIGNDFAPTNLKAPLSGNIASAYQQVKQVYSDYGVPVSEATLRNGAMRIATGENSLDAYKTNVIAQATSLYPSIAGSLKSGMTVRQVADPYIQTMGNLLERDPASITLQDPMIKKALQGSITTGTNGQSSATSTPLWQFEQQVRSDPRWQNTDNAKQSMSTLALQLGRDWGFAS